MTPAEELGYREGELFIVTGDTAAEGRSCAGHEFEPGDVVELLQDDGTDLLEFRRLSDADTWYVNLHDVTPLPVVDLTNLEEVDAWLRT